MHYRLSSNLLTHTPLKAADSTAQILEQKTGVRIATLEGEHSLGLNDCCWVDERLLVTASDDNSLVLWDIEMVIEAYVSYSMQMLSFLNRFLTDRHQIESG